MAYPLFHPESKQQSPLFLSRDAFRLAFPDESDHVEFKQGISADQIQQVAVAFSNADGGVILIGVAPTGIPVGIADSPATRDRIFGALAQARNLGRIWLHDVRVGEQSVVVVAIARRREGSAQTGDGRVLVRRGTEKVPLFGEELLTFMNTRALGRFEIAPTTAGLNQADTGALAALTAAYRWSDLDVESRLRERGFMTESGVLTVAGALLLLPDPSSVLGKVFIEIRRLTQSGSSDLRLEIRGPIPAQIERGVAELQRELGTESAIVGVRRREIPRLPERVVREALANAVAHRTYEVRGSAITVEIAAGEITITSPGSLPEPVTVQNIRETQAARNPAVIDALRRLQLAEDEGVGVDRIFEDMRGELLEDPVFVDTGSHVRVTLPTRGTVSVSERAWLHDLAERGDIDSGDRRLLVQAARGVHLSNRLARGLLGVGEAASRARLARLVDRGLLVRTGDRAATEYTIASELRVPSVASRDELNAIVINLARQQGSVTNTMVRAAIGVESEAALRLLTRLVRDGRLVRLGSRRGTRYVVPGDDVRRGDGTTTPVELG